MSPLVIKALEEPLKCEEEISVTVQYTITGETAESGSVTIVYLVGAGIKRNTAHFFVQLFYSLGFLFFSGFIQRRDSTPWL